jgi:sulfate/thiosulfate transport system ATP-binding protein
MSIVLEQITKRYAGLPVVNRLSLEIPDGQFFVLIGPSGSGKSTVLRMIAGLNSVDEGRILLHGRDVTGVPPQQRGVGFVFQHYALFGHMTVADNIEFALSVRRTPAGERRRRRDELLELVGLAGLGRRMPAQLSGGQQQRVALARALAHRPEVLLLDEPFGALDARIRVDLRRALKRIQAELGVTSVFVTHDQDEAFELADRLGVMNFGRLLEAGDPAELYQRPQTEFVATFLGTSNLLAGRAEPGGVRVGPVVFALKTSPEYDDSLPVARPVQVLFRPEDVVLAAAADEIDGTPLGRGKVEEAAFAGAYERVRLRLPAMAGVRPISPPVGFGENALRVEAQRPLEHSRLLPVQPGDTLWVGVRRMHALAYPGFSFLILTDGSEQAARAIDYGGQLARLAHARVTLLGHSAAPAELERSLQAAKEALGGGLASLDSRTTPDRPGPAIAREAEQRAHDLVILGRDPGLARLALAAGPHHVLLVPEGQASPTHALISVAGGEPGKEDVLFAGPLLHYLGAQATLLSILPTPTSLVDPTARRRREQYLADGARTLEALGVPASTIVRSGDVVDQIAQQLHHGQHDLLVLGAPLADRSGQIALGGVVERVIEAAACPVLIVRSRYAAAPAPGTASDGRIKIIEEIMS